MKYVETVLTGFNELLDKLYTPEKISEYLHTKEILAMHTLKYEKWSKL